MSTYAPGWSVRARLGPELCRYRARRTSDWHLASLRVDDPAPLERYEVECWILPSEHLLVSDLEREPRGGAAQCPTLISAKVRATYLAAHSLLQELLESYARSSVTVARPIHGGLRVVRPLRLRDVRVSLSRSAGLVAVALARGARVGVDAEPLIRAASAAEALAVLPGDQSAEAQQREPLRVWTAIEASLKAAGHGLACSRARCLTTVEHDRTVVTVMTSKRRASMSFTLLSIPWPGFQVTAAMQVVSP